MAKTRPAEPGRNGDHQEAYLASNESTFCTGGVYPIDDRVTAGGKR